MLLWLPLLLLLLLLLLLSAAMGRLRGADRHCRLVGQPTAT